MRYLWFTWKDRKHPQAGGAELFNEEIAKKMAAEGHEVIFLVGGFVGGKPEEIIDGYKVIRLGNRWTVYFLVYNYYKKYLQGWADVVIEEINTFPFMTQWYVKETRTLIFHQLCREIWFYQLFFPLNLIGYLLEPIYLWLMRQNKVITISSSTKNDLLKYGFNPHLIMIIIIGGLAAKPLANLNRLRKFSQPTILSLGNIRPMKRTLDIVKAFELAKTEINNLQLKIVGNSHNNYGRKVLNYIKKSLYTDDIEYLGQVDSAEKSSIMQKSHLIAVTSVKEGWGLIVSEAAACGTPAVVYNVDGLRDAVFYGKSGYITNHNTPSALADKIVTALRDKNNYQHKQHFAWKKSQELTFDKCYQQFMKSI